MLFQINVATKSIPLATGKTPANYSYTIFPPSGIGEGKVSGTTCVFDGPEGQYRVAIVRMDTDGNALGSILSVPFTVKAPSMATVTPTSGATSTMVDVPDSITITYPHYEIAP